MTRPLEGWWAKIDRAKEHLDLLDELVSSYLEEKPYRFLGEEEWDGTYRTRRYYLQAVRFPPDEVWGPIIGDVIHNLRSALDHLAWELAVPGARAHTPRRIEFPIFLDDPETDPDARGALAKKIKCLRPEAHAIVDGAQPYKTGNSHHPLWLLQALWNTDKHRVLHTAGFLFASAHNIGNEDAATWGFSGWHWGAFNRVDSENRTLLEESVALIEAAPDNRLEDDMRAYENVTVDVSLGHIAPLPALDIEPYAGLPVRQMLRHIRDYVVGELVPRLSALL